MFNQEQLDIGVNYLQNNNFIDDFKNYQLTNKDNKECKIYCLDEFYPFPNTEENIDKNINIKWDLESLVKTGSCYGLATYIYELIIYVKEI